MLKIHGKLKWIQKSKIRNNIYLQLRSQYSLIWGLELPSPELYEVLGKGAKPRERGGTKKHFSKINKKS